MYCKNCHAPMTTAEAAAYQDRCEECWVKATSHGSGTTQRRCHAYIKAEEFAPDVRQTFETIFRK